MPTLLDFVLFVGVKIHLDSVAGQAKSGIAVKVGAFFPLDVHNIAVGKLGGKLLNFGNIFGGEFGTFIRAVFKCVNCPLGDFVCVNLV